MTLSILFQYHILLINHPLLQTEVILWKWSRKHVQIKLVDVCSSSIFSHMQQANCKRFLATSLGCKTLDSPYIIRIYGR